MLRIYNNWLCLLLVCMLLSAEVAALSSVGQQGRRQLIEATLMGWTIDSGFTRAANAVVLESDAESSIQKTITGVQYRDDRVGQGPEITKDDILVMHILGMTRDGNVFVDTRAGGRDGGKPILHKIGIVNDYDFFGGDSSKRPIVTLGIEDGIRGMKMGGIRRMVVPGALGYGHAGVSRFDAMRMGLLKPVPRDELLRYEVELLRCVDVPGVAIGQACCTEPNYPCKTDDPNNNNPSAGESQG